MSDESSSNRHRGHHPADPTLFAGDALPELRTAVAELSWLLERDYSEVAALELVGNRHSLSERQRRAVARCACGDTTRQRRTVRRLEAHELRGRTLLIDGFNCIITLEAAFAGSLVLRGRDSAHRDLSSVHGSYRRVEETAAAIAAITERIQAVGVAAVRWLLDRPVSNSGQLKEAIAAAGPAGLPWEIALVYNPDRELVAAGDHVVASSDGWVLDHCGGWIDLPGAVIAAAAAPLWLVDLGAPP